MTSSTLPSRRTYEELLQLPDDVLLDLTQNHPEAGPETQAAYEEALDAAEILQGRGVIESPSAQSKRRTQEAKEKAAKTKQRTRKERQQRKLEDGVLLPAWWFTSGRWAKLGAAGAKVAPVIAGLIDHEERRGHLTYEEIAGAVGVHRETAKRGANEAVRAGLIRRHTKPVPGASPPRSACFYSIPKTGAQT